MSTLLTILVFGAVVLIFDAIASYLLRSDPQKYARLILVSLSINILSGMAASWFVEGDLWVHLLVAAIAGGAVAAIDATLGWWISAAIGPGKLPKEKASRSTLARAIAQVILLGVFAGLVGGIVERLIQR